MWNPSNDLKSFNDLLCHQHAGRNIWCDEAYPVGMIETAVVSWNKEGEDDKASKLKFLETEIRKTAAIRISNTIWKVQELCMHDDERDGHSKSTADGAFHSTRLTDKSQTTRTSHTQVRVYMVTGHTEYQTFAGTGSSRQTRIQHEPNVLSCKPLGDNITPWQLWPENIIENSNQEIKADWNEVKMILLSEKASDRKKVK